MSDLKDRVMKAWAADMTARMGGAQVVYPGRRPGTLEPPFTVLVIRRMDLTTPGSNVWKAEGRLVVVCNKEHEGDQDQKDRLKAAFAALEATDVPCEDLDEGVRLYGVAVSHVEDARMKKVYGDVVFFEAGVGPTPG